MEGPNCQCGLLSAKRVSKKEASFNREFFTCPQPQGLQCRFFKWADQWVPGDETKDTAATEPPKKLRRCQADGDISAMMGRDVNQNKELTKALMETVMTLSKVVERLEKVSEKIEKITPP